MTRPIPLRHTIHDPEAGCDKCGSRAATVQSFNPGHEQAASPPSKESRADNVAATNPIQHEYVAQMRCKRPDHTIASCENNDLGVQQLSTDLLAASRCLSTASGGKGPPSTRRGPPWVILRSKRFVQKLLLCSC